MSVNNSTIDFLNELGSDRDTYVMVKVPKLIKVYLEHQAKQKDISLSEEAYIKICESLLYEHKSSQLFDGDAATEAESETDWDEFIFNEALAIDETKLKARD